MGKKKSNEASSLPGVTYVGSGYYEPRSLERPSDELLAGEHLGAADEFILQARAAAGHTGDALILPAGVDPAFDKRLGDYLLSLTKQGPIPDDAVPIGRLDI